MSDAQSKAVQDYNSAGVDIDVGDAVIDSVKGTIGESHNVRVLGSFGHFGGFYRIGPLGDAATLVASIDGVGTKLKVAILANQHAGIGQDIVHHCVNDILACGARPIFFLDYYAAGHLEPEIASTVIGSIASACRDLGIPLLGGETAEMPGMYSEGDYDLAGVVVGIVEQSQIVDGSEIRAGDQLVGIPSNGFHTNGYSLIRSVLGLNDGEVVAQDQLRSPLPWNERLSLAEALLVPHRCYLNDIGGVVAEGKVVGMAHITGGGISGNLSRIVPDGLVARVNADIWTVPRIIEHVVQLGDIVRDESYRVFNMGIGYVLVCRDGDLGDVLDAVQGSSVIGEIRRSDGPQKVDLVFDGRC